MATTYEIREINDTHIRHAFWVYRLAGELAELVQTFGSRKEAEQYAALLSVRGRQ